MYINNEYTVKVEKMINEGDGLARINSLPVFIKNACSDDVLKIKIIKENKNYLTAEIKEIIEPSQYRVKPLCPLSSICGSCSWQHIKYERQLIEKQNIVFETIKNITQNNYIIEKTIPSPKIREYRCKVQYPVTEKKSGRIVSGYYKINSHELVNIKYCPMQNPVINDINEFIKTEIERLHISGYKEKSHSGLIRHIIYRYSNNTKEIIIIFVINSNNIDKRLKNLSEILCNKYESIKGVCVNYNTQKTNVITGKITEKIIGNDYYFENLSGIKYKVSANSFFQVNPDCAQIIFNKVKDLAAERVKTPAILDAYSGVSSFGIWLSDIADKVVCIEEVKSASNDAIENIKINNCNNVEIINGDAAKSFKELITKGVKFDISITDPPRKGCSTESLNNLIKLTEKYIIYVSCNIATLARDMKFLIENSFIPEYIQPVDMFPNTYHVETIVVFKNVK